MTENRLARRSSTAVVALTLALVVAVSSAQQAPEAPYGGVNPAASSGVPLPDSPQVFSKTGQTFRMVPLKGLSYPFALAFLPNGDMLITERRAGRLRLVRNGVLDPEPIGPMPAVATTGQKGLMDIALHPRFPENGVIFFTYSKAIPGENNNAIATLARARYDGSHQLSDVRDVLVPDAKTTSSVSRIAFGPDGKIYMSIGVPVGNPGDAQNPGTHHGKILRLNEDGTAPPDNPFVGKPGYRPEIYALGIRNALGLIFHPTTGELWENENGPQGGDEINIIKPGGNYGWPVISYGRAYSGEAAGGPTGPRQAEPCAPGMEQPFLAWVPAIAVSGMTYYTGDKFPQWKGSILVGALGGQHIQRVVLNRRGLPVRRDVMLSELRQRIREVRQGPDGLIYLLTDEEKGALIRLEPVPTP